MTKLSDLIERGYAIPGTFPAIGTTLRVEKDMILCCPLGAAYLATGLCDLESLKTKRAIAPALLTVIYGVKDVVYGKGQSFDLITHKGFDQSLAFVILDKFDHMGYSWQDIVQWLRSMDR